MDAQIAPTSEKLRKKGVPKTMLKFDAEKGAEKASTPFLFFPILDRLWAILVGRFGRGRG